MTESSRPRLHPLLLAAGLALLYFAVARASLLLAFQGSNASPVWPPTGLAIASLLLLGPRYWPAILLVAFFANLAGFQAGSPVLELRHGLASASIALGNSAEALVAALLMRRLLGDELRLDSQSQVFHFVAVILAASTLSASVGTLSLVLFGIVPRLLADSVLWTWWLGDVCGGLLLVPLALAWLRRETPARPPRPLLEKLVLAAAVLAGAYGIFLSGWLTPAAARPYTFLLFPLLAWAALRHGLRGASAATLAMAVCSVWGTTRGQGPFASGPLNESLVLLDSFLALCTAITLVLSADRSERHEAGLRYDTPGQAVPWLALLGSLGLTIGAWQLLAREAEALAQQRFELLSQQVEGALSARLDDFARVLRSCAGLFAASQAVSRDEWKTFIASQDIEKHLPGVQGVGYAAYARPDGLPALLESGREGLPEFALRPAGPRAEYTAIIYLEPMNRRNAKAFGYDMYTEAVRRKAMELARDHNEASLSGKVTLVQEDEADPLPGFLMYLPVYRQGLPSGTPAERRAALSGYVYAAFRAPEFVEAVLGTRWPEIEVSVFDERSDAPTTPLYAPRERHAGKHSRETLRLLNWHGHSWWLQLHATPIFDAGTDREKSQMVFVAGALVSLLLFSMVRAQSLTSARAQSLARIMTSELSAREQRYRSLFETASDAILIVVDGDISDCNPAALAMLGYGDKQSLLGKPLSGLSPALPASPDQAAALALPDALHADTQRIERQFLRRDGSHFLAQISATAVITPDSRNEVHVLLRDITAQRAWEDGLRQAKEAAETSNKAKSDFVANISHELRTPLNAILGMAQMLENAQLPPEQHKHVGMIHSAGSSLLSLLNDLLDFSKIEAGKMSIEREAFELDEVIEALAAIMSATARHKPLDLLIGQEPGVPCRLIGDGLRLQQVLLNLISNALKFTEEGQIALLIELAAPREGRELRLAFRVRDTGIGISAEQAERLFSAFTQADPSVTRKFGGSGLGLAISKQLVELMGGQIRLRSEPGRGTEFCVELPFETEACGEVRFSEAPRRVRLIDRDGEARRYIEATLNAWGWQVLTKDAPPPVACDWVIYTAHGPQGEPDELRRRLEREAGGVGLPILCLLSPYEREHLDAGAYVRADIRLVLKPVTARSLREALTTGSGGTTPSRRHDDERLLAGCRILLAEDNELNQAVAAGLLEHAGASLVIANDGREAVERLSQAGGDFDLVLMDVHMPNLDGLSATRILREKLDLKLPVIAMTAAVMAKERSAYLAAGMNEVIAKPFEAGELIATIGRLLHRGPPAIPPQAPLATGTVLALDKLEALLQRSPGTAPQLRLILGNMLASTPERWAEVRRLQRMGETEKARGLLHTMKGSLGMFVSTDFVTALAGLEEMLKSGATETFDTAFERQEPTLNALLGELAAWLAQTTPPEEKHQ